MHVSLTPELEKIVKEKVRSGLYNNASEVIREALRFMETHEELIYQLKLERLRAKLAEGEQHIAQGRYRELGHEDIGAFLHGLKAEADEKLDKERQ
nr:type II toxin-antitoxin system ParD family antitoxin [Gammaproteobacteria bacterium]